MYKLLLTFRYLRRKLIPVFALLAVMLCVAMVIIVISVMGGFHDLLLNSGRTLMGDVSAWGGLDGFPHYQEMIDEIEALPEAESATPIIIAYGLLKIGDQVKGVQVYGVVGGEQDRVTRFRDTLIWNRAKLEDYPDVARFYGDADPVELGVQMKLPPHIESDRPPIVLGLEISGANVRMPDGSYRHWSPMPGRLLTLSVMPITARGDFVEPQTDQFGVVNEFKSGVYEADSQRVFIPFDVAQRMMLMEETERVDPADPTKVVGTVPARTTEIHVRAAPGVTAEQLRTKVHEVYERLVRKHDDLPAFMQIETWAGRQAFFLKAVKNEKTMMTVLFGIISIVAVAMIGVVFYMIVLEKTRDIGILRAIGASRMGVASIFLSFGAAIGTIGAALGTTGAYFFVTRINDVHDWLGNGLGVGLLYGGCALGGLVIAAGVVVALRLTKAPHGLRPLWFWALMLGGIAAGAGVAAGVLASRENLAEELNRRFSVVVWDKTVYFFDRIPNRVDWVEIAVIIVVAILASIVGALVPAIKAARVDPVESLRYE